MKGTPSTSVASAAGLAVLVVLVALYVSGYYLLCYDVMPCSVLGVSMPVRMYRSPFFAAIYAPAAAVENAIAGGNVETGYEKPFADD